MKLYQAFAKAYFKAQKDQDTQELESLVNLLPHGSGIDCDYWVRGLVKSNKSHTKNTVEFGNSFRTNKNGFYAGYINFIVKISPSPLEQGSLFELEISGRFRGHKDLREYLYETYDYALRGEVFINPETGKWFQEQHWKHQNLPQRMTMYFEDKERKDPNRFTVGIFPCKCEVVHDNLYSLIVAVYPVNNCEIDHRGGKTNELF